MANLAERRDLRKYKLNEPVEIAGEDWDFAWVKSETEALIDGWEKGLSVPDIAQTVDRPDHEVFIMLMWLHYTKRIEEREGYFWGTK